MHRNPKNFSPSPDSFWPDRWGKSKENTTTIKDETTKQEIITNVSAFIPFSYGPQNCVGRGLALVEMRIVVALLLQRFHIKLADGYDSDDWIKHLEDYFVLHHGKLLVNLQPRI